MKGITAGVVSFNDEDLSTCDSIKYSTLDNDILFLHSTKGGCCPGQCVQPFLLLASRTTHPGINVSFGPFSSQRGFGDLRKLTDTVISERERSLWKIQVFPLEDRIFVDKPKVQAAFHITGTLLEQQLKTYELPCVRVTIVRLLQQISMTCLFEGVPSLCIATLIVPTHWFGDSDAKAFQGTSLGYNTARLHYRILHGQDCSVQRTGVVNMSGDAFNSSKAVLIGNIRLYPAPAIQLTRKVWLSSDILIHFPMTHVLHRQDMSVPLLLSRNSTIKHLVIRVKGKKGIVLKSVHLSDSASWEVHMQMMDGAKHTVVTLQFSRKPTIQSLWDDGSVEIAHLLFEIGSTTSQMVTRRILWQVEYDEGLAIKRNGRVTTELTVTEKDIRAIIAIVDSRELVNTAVLSGQPLTVPLRLLLVDGDGQTIEVTSDMKCQPANPQVVKVSAGCEWVYVDGSETHGSTKARVHVMFEKLAHTVELVVWFPRIPLILKMSPPALSVVDGWRVPLHAQNSTNDDGKIPLTPGCGAQSQVGVVRVFTKLCAETTENDDGQECLLGNKWLVDVSKHSKTNLRIKNGSVAQLRDSLRVAGVSPGNTTIQVMAPLSGAILGEQAVHVRDEAVLVTGLNLKPFVGLALMIRADKEDGRVLKVTAIPQRPGPGRLTENTALQVWIKFSDGLKIPLDIYDKEDYIISLGGSMSGFGDGHKNSKLPLMWSSLKEGNAFAHVMLHGPEICQEIEMESVLATGKVSATVMQKKVAKKYANGISETMTDDWKKIEEWRDNRESKNESCFGDDETPGEYSTTEKGYINITGAEIEEILDNQQKLCGQSQHLRNSIRTEQETFSTRNPTDMKDVQNSMFTLLGVFCLAMFMFLINCLVYMLRSRCGSVHRHSEALPHAHEWVSLSDICDPGSLLSQEYPHHVARLYKQTPPKSEQPLHVPDDCGAQENIQQDNVLSSPTLQRKNSLLVLPAFSGRDCRPIRISSPISQSKDNSPIPFSLEMHGINSAGHGN
uniref:Transmembrane protein 132D n=1 Tax=Eptatretus burgeri TaxID=7764 RepID=A0A8C4Q8U4_EPTBU